MPDFTIAIHGGAGTIIKEDLTPELEEKYKTSLRMATDAGYLILEKGGSAVDAVIAACVALENDILFNAGRGSVFSKTGTHEMDAAIMNGADLKAGAIAGVNHIKNPVLLAQAVMQHSNHVFLSGSGAIEFALKQGIGMEAPDYFFSQFRYDQWIAIRDTNLYALDHGDAMLDEKLKDKKFGTVGAVACDMFGNLAAATSTGGMTNKTNGRIGDSPIIGAGTYANNKTCAVSCTGHGEIFMEAVAAYDVSCLMEYKDLTLEQAMEVVVNEKLVKMKGEGGMIGVDKNANAVFAFNTPGMYRASKSSNGNSEVLIYKENLVRS